MADTNSAQVEDETSLERSPDRVGIPGAGFGGLAVAQGLKSSDVEIVVVGQRNHHTFQPLLYQLASAGLDVNNKWIELTNGTNLSYDYLVLALGAVTADYGVTGVAKFGFGLKSGADAQRLRNHVLTQFELAESATTIERTAQTTIVIAGGGPTGVEMAGGFSEVVDRVFR